MRPGLTGDHATEYIVLVCTAGRIVVCIHVSSIENVRRIDGAALAGSKCEGNDVRVQIRTVRSSEQDTRRRDESLVDGFSKSIHQTVEV